MTTDRWQQIKEVFNAALARPLVQRTAFLAEACAGDNDLRNEVEALLAKHETPESLLDSQLGAVAAQMANQAVRFASEQMIGPYRLQERLGAGDIGEVWRADDTRLGRTVAIKLLLAHLANSRATIARFQHEAKVLATLAHPNVVALYDYGEADGIFYTVTELLEGTTLRAQLSHGALAWPRAVELAAEVAAGLAATHAKGLIHCDLKPENIFITRAGGVKILGFGSACINQTILQESWQESWQESRQSSLATAKHIAGVNEARLTPSEIVGTVQYMSPEQVLGEEVDQRTDCFSLGVVLYEMLTGVPPFKSDSAAALRDAIVHHTPLPLAQAAPGLPTELEAVVNGALEKDQTLRIQTAQDLSAALKRALRTADDSGTGLANLTESGAAASLIPRDVPRAGLIKLFALAASVLLVGLVWFLWRAFNNRPGEVTPWLYAQASALTAQSEAERFPSLAPDGKRLVYARQVNGQWDIFAQRVGGTLATNLTANPAEDTQPAYSPNGQRIAFYSARGGGGLYLMGESGETPHRLVAGKAFHPAWSPDSQELLYTEETIQAPFDRAPTSTHPCWVLNVATQQKRLVSTHDVAQPQWSPNGHRIAYWGARPNAQRDIWTMTPDGQSVVEVTNDAALDWNPVWSPDGRYLYFISDRGGTFNLWRIAVDERTGQVQGAPEPIRAPSPHCRDLCFSRDGQRLVYTQVITKFTLQRWGFDAARAALTGAGDTLINTTRSIHELQLSPDGSHLAFRSTAGNQEDLAVLRTDGQEAPRLLTEDEFKDRGPRWSPDGQTLAFYSNRGAGWGIWTIRADGSNLRELVPGSAANAFFPRWSSDGTRLIFTRSGGVPFITPVAAPAPQLLLANLEPAPIFWVGDWSLDDRRALGGWRAQAADRPHIAWYDLATHQLKVFNFIGTREPVWMPDQRSILCAIDNKLYLLDRQTEQLRAIAYPNAYQIESYTVSRDGRTIYFNLEVPESDIWMLSLK